MKIITEKDDISELVESITWSGDTRQVARKVNFTIAKNPRDKNFPKVRIEEGEKIKLLDDSGKLLFYGVIFDIDKSASSATLTFLAYDFMFYVNNSDINRVFDDTPENITRQICKELQIEPGSLAETGIRVYMPCLGKKAYEGIMMAYTYAARKNGKKYMPLVQHGNKLSVIQKGTPCGAVLSDDMIDAAFKSTLQNLVNKVFITDKNNHVIKVVQDKKSQAQFGTVQKVYKQEEGKDATKEAENLLNGAELSATADGLDDSRAISGYSIIVKEKDTGLNGKFYIESDSHTYTNGKAEMQLNLAFENLMDEKEIEKEEGKKHE